MMFHFKYNKGFSLIELVVVMAIVAILMSLSGGVLQKNIKQQELHVELEKVKQLFRKYSYEAYFRGGLINVRLEKNVMIISESIEFEENPMQKHYFKQLTFVAQNYLITTKGVISPSSYSVLNQNNIKQFTIESIFNEISN